MRFNLKDRITLSSAFRDDDNNLLVKHEKKYIEENDRDRIEAVKEWKENTISTTFSVGD